MSDATDLNLLMAHADDGAPVLPEGLPDSAARVADPPADDPSASHFWDEGGDPNDLGLQRWGVIAPEGPTGDRLLALVAPLMRLRGEQQGDEAVKVYRVPARMTQDEAMRWRKREFETGADLNIELPRYQLILGDLDQVPLAVQQVQQSDGYVGRLAFDGDDGYLAYVDKVLRHERRAAAAPPEPARSLFFTVHDGTAATAVGHRALIAPGLEVVRRRQAAGQYPAREILELGDRVTPSPDELMRAVQDPDPGVLFTLSHGEGAPRGGWRSYADQRARQGAMSFGREGHIVGDELKDRTFMPGGVWFMLACYGGGTPSTSAYRHWLAQLQAAGQFRGRVEGVLAGLPAGDERPFVAAVPKAALASAGGPLAFMGHIDLAWTYGFQELDSGATNRPARFMAITRSLLKRDRCGVSLRELVRFFDQTNVELTALYDREAQARAGNEPYALEAARLGHLWMLRQDLAAYVLLGDPAVRLPPREAAAAAAPRPIEVRAPRPEPTAAASIDVAPAGPVDAVAARPVDMFPAAGPVATVAARPVDMFPAAAPGDAPAPSIALEILEEALAQVVLGERDLAALAARAGVTREQLARRVAAYREAGRRSS
ncbi:MAG: hypothetical protein JNL82_37610 [Myxococcales bacterium]|nr:hypothetical protein [Myxococcales bacterium]